MNKRRRTSSVSRLEEDLDESTSEQSPTIATRKRKRLDPVNCLLIYHDAGVLKNFAQNLNVLLELSIICLNYQ